MKRYSISKTLIIVESPAKCGKIENILGSGYKCLASFGHLRTLSSLKSIDIVNNFQPTYTNIDDDYKRRQIGVISREIARVDDVILATDDDREGEAIAWHLCMIFNLPLTTKRIVFHEITENAIINAVQHPRQINMNLVNSQQARQILDLLVGYNISPVLWKHISNSKLSAGRCQTPALRLVYDNHVDIFNSASQKVYKTTGLFTSLMVTFELNKQFDCETIEMRDFLENSKRFEHVYSCSSPKLCYKKSPDPFSTSTLQQAASNELLLSPKDTMKHAQQLYEHGYITYMRTDSHKYSCEFIDKTKSYILKTYNSSKYINEEIDTLLHTNLGAHEAIRPTSIFVSLNQIKDEINGKKEIHVKALKLYELIWKNALKSCMSKTVYHSIVAEITAYDNNLFRFQSEHIIFDGWQIMDKLKEAREYNFLLQLKAGPILYTKILATVLLKNIKSHYSEAVLVQLLEKKGIGRPSTFSSLIDKIQERGYVTKENISGKKIECIDYELGSDIVEINTSREFGNEKNKLVIQPLGIRVIEFLIKRYTLFEYEYTQQMEDELDIIASTGKSWNSLCETCYKNLNIEVKDDMSEMIDDKNSFLIGRYGPVIKCVEDDKTTFKAIKKDVDITKLNEYTLEELVDTDVKKMSIILGKYKGEDLIIKRGKFGLYLVWGINKKSLTCFGNRPIENITYMEVLKLLDAEEPTQKYVREINASMSIRKGKFGDYIYYKTSKMKTPKFFKLDGFENYKTCELSALKLWITEKYL